MKTAKSIFIILIGSVAIIAYFILVATIIRHICSNPNIIFRGEDFGGGYRLTADGTNTLAIVHPDYGIVVDNTVLEYAFDSIFIIASQRPWNSSIIPNMYALNYHERNKAFKKSEYKQYWIINKKQQGENLGYLPYPKYEMRDYDRFEEIENSIYMVISPSSYRRMVYSNIHGPFHLEEFLLKRKELGVPDSLVLKKYWKWAH